MRVRSACCLPGFAFVALIICLVERERDKYIYRYIYAICLYTLYIFELKLWLRNFEPKRKFNFSLNFSPLAVTVNCYVCVCVCEYVLVCVCVCLYFLNQTFAMKLQLAMPISPIVGISFCGTVIKMQTAICHFQLLLSVFFLLFAPPLRFFCLAF